MNIDSETDTIGMSMKFFRFQNWSAANGGLERLIYAMSLSGEDKYASRIIVDLLSITQNDSVKIL